MSDKEKVYNFLKFANRPFSSVDVFNNLHNDVGKSSTVKCLDSLVVEGKIIEKLYGKQKIYLLNQNNVVEINAAEVVAMQQKFDGLQTELSDLISRVNKCESELKVLCNSLSTDDAKIKLKELDEEVHEKLERLEKLRDNKDQITRKDRDLILNERTRFMKEWRRRKRLAKDMMDTVLENYPKSKKAFIEELGIEQDEEYNAVMPPDVA